MEEILLRRDGLTLGVGETHVIDRVVEKQNEKGTMLVARGGGYLVWPDESVGEPPQVGDALEVIRNASAAYPDGVIVRKTGRPRPTGGQILEFRNHGFTPLRTRLVVRYVDRNYYSTDSMKVLFEGGGFMELLGKYDLRKGDTLDNFEKVGVRASAIFVTSKEITTGAEAPKGQGTMVGQVYSAVVVRTKTVAAGEGLTAAAVQVSEIVSTKSNFIALSDEMARAVALAEAMVVDGKPTDLKVDDPTQPVEVKLSKFGGTC